MKALEYHRTQKAQIIPETTLLEDHDLEIVVREPNVFGDFKIAAVVPHSRDQSETRQPIHAIHRDPKPRQLPPQLRKTAVPVRELPELSLQLQIQFMHNPRVQSRPGH